MQARSLASDHGKESEVIQARKRAISHRQAGKPLCRLISSAPCPPILWCTADLQCSWPTRRIGADQPCRPPAANYSRSRHAGCLPQGLFGVDRWAKCSEGQGDAGQTPCKHVLRRWPCLERMEAPNVDHSGDAKGSYRAAPRQGQNREAGDRAVSQSVPFASCSTPPYSRSVHPISPGIHRSACLALVLAPSRPWPLCGRSTRRRAPHMLSPLFCYSYLLLLTSYFTASLSLPYHY